MTRRFCLALILGLVGGSWTRAATCTGANPCKACKNCSACAHCKKKGNTCGVCKKKTTT